MRLLRHVDNQFRLFGRLFTETKEKQAPIVPKFEASFVTNHVHYHTQGPEDAEITVVFIHGFTLAASGWFLQAAALPKNVRAIFVDLRGHGDSGSCEIGDCTIDGAADDVVSALEDANATGPVIVVGHSLGGMVTMNLLRRYQELRERTKAVILIATAVDSFASQGVPQVLALPVVERIRDAVEASPDEARKFRDEISRLVAPVLATTVFSTPIPEPIVNFHAKLIYTTPLNTYVGFLDDLQCHNEVEGAKLLAGIPGVIIVGGEDHVTPVEQAEHINELWPDAGLQVAPGCGHMVIFEQPELINKAIAQFASVDAS